jgi:Domain of unknown function (DUF5911)
VATDGSIDWFCAPRFDSPSVFEALLDRNRGRHCRTRPAVEAFTTKQLYLPDTAVLITRFMTEAGVGEVVDFMPVSSSKVASERHRIVRLLWCVPRQHDVRGWTSLPGLTTDASPTRPGWRRTVCTSRAPARR